jgi:hypothetical protein
MYNFFFPVLLELWAPSYRDLFWVQLGKILRTILPTQGLGGPCQGLQARPHHGGSLSSAERIGWISSGKRQKGGYAIKEGVIFYFDMALCGSLCDFFSLNNPL